MAEENYGALTGLNLDEKEKNDPFAYNVYQAKSFDSGLTGQELQSSYGTAKMPVFDWVRLVQSGQRTYDPSNDFDRDMMEEYEKETDVPDDLMSPQELMAQQALYGSAGQVGTVIGKPIGDALVNPVYADMSVGEKLVQGTKNIYADTPQRALQKASDLTAKQQTFLKQNPDVVYQPEFKDPDTAKIFGLDDELITLENTNTMKDVGLGKVSAKDNFSSGFMKKDTLDNLKYADKFDPSDVEFASRVDPASPTPLNLSEPITGSSISQAADLGFQEQFGNYIDDVGDRLNPFGESGAGASNFSSAAGASVFNFGFRVAAGQDIDDAAKSAADAGAITYLTTALLTATPLAPFATIIGGVVGGFVGRVICNELMRQGIMDRKQVILDYKFTRDYLTPTHVAGYHVWAVWMVKQMRKGRLVGLWSHIAGHRANEIAYIYGERDKPDYLGKLYRKILEPICWTVGTFCKETDWSILYKKKEI